MEKTMKDTKTWTKENTINLLKNCISRREAGLLDMCRERYRLKEKRKSTETIDWVMCETKKDIITLKEDLERLNRSNK
jgi:hypothetical protein